MTTQVNLCSSHFHLAEVKTYNKMPQWPSYYLTLTSVVVDSIPADDSMCVMHCCPDMIFTIKRDAKNKELVFFQQKQ